jgi:TPR repeat protein
MYDTGDVVVQDYKEAVKWYRLAAEQGYLIAQYNLGVMYYNGQGVVQDYIIAHMWFCIAAANGYENAVESRDLTAKKMSSEDVSKAQGLARAWVNVHP